MARTDSERFTQAVTYIKALSPALANDITMNSAGRADALGASISLEGGGYWKAGTKEQHAAVRALLLCHRIYLKTPYTASDLAPTPILKSTFQTKSEQQVKEAILCYVPTANPTLEGLAKAAEAIKNPNGVFNWETRTRADQTLGANPVCFNAVKLWLFNAGFVSLRWYASDGMEIDAHRANNHLGNGTIVPRDQVHTIPRGYMFNFHVIGQKSVCHWGVSLGGGWAAGSNTTASADFGPKTAPVTAAVTFRSGGGTYGEFTMASSADVCKLKYALHGTPVAPEITIRQIDPSIVATYF